MPRIHVDAAHASTRLALRVRFCDTDMMGIVHHANYLAYFEAGRVEWLRRRGVAYASWAAGGLHLAVAEVGVHYMAPAHFDDVLEVVSELAEVRAASVLFRYRLERSGDLLTTGFTLLACVDDSKRLRRLPPDKIATFQRPEQTPSEGPAP